MAGGTFPGLDEQTSDLAVGRAHADVPLARSSTEGQRAGTLGFDPAQHDALFDVTAHARLSARLVASPGEAMEDLRVLGLQTFEARAHADAAIQARLAHDEAAARAWNDAFERELAQHV